MSLAERGALNVPLVELIRTASGKEPSQRPWETVSPLAACLGLQPDTTYALGKETDLASKIMSLVGGVVLVCWEHKK
jgi:hypothetical protein